MGRPPKNPEDRARSSPSRMVPAVTQDKIFKNEPIKLPEWDGKMRGPALGRTPPEGGLWHPLTLKWWKTWRKSSQAMFMLDTDWESLFVGAVLHNKIMWGCSHTALAALTAQLAKRESLVGAAIEDRVRLNMVSSKGREESAEAEIKVEAKKGIDYMERLLGKDKDGTT